MDLWLACLGGNTPRLNKPIKTKKNACTGGGGDYWFDSMEEDESLPAIDAAFFDAIEGPDCMVPEPVTKKVCKSCKRNLSEAEHFMPGRKTCHEWRSNATIWEKNVGKRGGMRSWTLITTVTRSSRLLELIIRRDVVVYNKFLLFTCWAHLLTFAFDTFGGTLAFNPDPFLVESCEVIAYLGPSRLKQ